MLLINLVPFSSSKSLLFSGVGGCSLIEDHIKDFLRSEEFSVYLFDHCDVRRISVKLLAKNTISLADCEAISPKVDIALANSCLLLILHEDPSVTKLQSLSEVLKSDTTRSTHQELAKRIDQFLKKYQI